MEVLDWDQHTVVLVGLDISINPSDTRKAAEKGLVQPFQDSKVQEQLRSTAVYLYNHQKAAPIYHNNVGIGCSPQTSLQIADETKGARWQEHAGLLRLRSFRAQR